MKRFRTEIRLPDVRVVAMTAAFLSNFDEVDATFEGPKDLIAFLLH